MAQLKGSKTHENLKAAFAGESQANRRYLYFAKQADIEGYPDVGGLFRDTAEAETGHAHGHLDFLKSAGDPATDKPIGSTDKNLGAAVADDLPFLPSERRDRLAMLDRELGNPDAPAAEKLRRVLEACGGNKSEAARRLGVSRKTLERKLGVGAEAG